MSSRFGGAPKGLFTVGGRRIIDCVADAMRASTSSLVVVSNAPDAERWLPEARVVRDARSERGSLVAIHSALQAAGEPVLVVAWDMPFVAPMLIERIARRAASAQFAAIPEGPTGLEPFCAAYAPACLPLLEAALDRGDFRLRAFVASLPAIERLPIDDVKRIGDPARLFFNVNEPSDLATAERMLAED